MAKALTTLGRSPYCRDVHALLRLVKIGGKLKEKFLDNETQSFPYILDMAATVKVARNSDEMTLNQISAQRGYAH